MMQVLRRPVNSMNVIVENFAFYSALGLCQQLAYPHKVDLRNFVTSVSE